jgi:putative membrane protein
MLRIAGRLCGESSSMPLSALAILAAHPIVHVNASLNATAAALLLVGFYFIKKGRVDAHKRAMLSAFAISAVFLACYVWYHLQVQHVKFTHPGAVKYVYYAILASHVLLAITVPFLAIRQTYLGFRALGWGDKDVYDPKKFIEAAAYREKHIRLARWTFPIWLYVSITGVIVYVMLYHLWPPNGQ